MSIQFNHNVNRKPEVLKRFGFSNTTLHNLQKRKLFVSSINIGERAVGFLEHELQAIIAARAANQSHDQIRVLVAKLEEQRKQTANAFLNAVAA